MCNVNTITSDQVSYEKYQERTNLEGFQCKIDKEILINEFIELLQVIEALLMSSEVGEFMTTPIPKLSDIKDKQCVSECEIEFGPIEIQLMKYQKLYFSKLFESFKEKKLNEINNHEDYFDLIGLNIIN
jgi:hypothetical protein